MRRVYSFLITVCFVVLSIDAKAGTCLPIKHPLAGGTACLYPVDRTKNPDILYFFHGFTRGAEDWDRERFQAVRSAWTRLGVVPPTVISVSFGDRWLLSADDGNRIGLDRIFVQDIMPKLEGAIGGQGPGRRMILGESMGGSNAALLFARHPNLFSRAAFICPAMTSVSPFASAAELDAYIARTGANAQATRFLMGIARQMIGRPELWNPNSPLEISKDLFNRNTPPIYVSCGERDELGFFEGAKTFAQQAYNRGVQVAWAPRPGGHCTNPDVEGIAMFFRPLTLRHYLGRRH